MAQAVTQKQTLEVIGDASKKVADSFVAMRGAIAEAGPLEPKYRELINVAGFVVEKNERGFRTHCSRALQAGATPEEVRQTICLLLGASAGAAVVANALEWAEELIAAQ